MRLIFSLNSAIAPTISRLKPYIRWLILGGTLFFLAHTLRQNWQEVTAIRIDGAAWGLLAIALFITLFAHIWAGWVWGWILKELGYHALGTWTIFSYLKNNVAKYLPGNVWHFYGRIMAAKSLGIPIEGAAVSVVMEPVMMAIAALIVAFISSEQLNLVLQLVGLLIGLTLIHPRLMNPILKKLASAKSKLKARRSGDGQDSDSFNRNQTHPESLQEESTPLPHRSPYHSSIKTHAPVSSHPQTSSIQSPPTSYVTLKRYPIIPLIGELVFLILRGIGFIAAVMALYPVTLENVFPILSAFSLAWMLGLIVPGAPGGIGVFEATALALLGGTIPSGILLGAVAFYRLISTLAEAIGAAIAWVIEQCTPYS